MKFPRVVGETLEGERRALPRALPGGPTLAILSFRWQQRSLVDPWCSLAAHLADRCDGFDFAELLVVDDRSGMFRPSVSDGMRAGLLSKHRHDRMVVVRVDKARFRRSLGLLGEETIYALLVDDGQVVRQSVGALTRETANAVQSLVREWDDHQRADSEADGEAGVGASECPDDPLSTEDDGDDGFDWVSSA